MRYIAQYEIRGLLGRGGMGAVYKVRHPKIGKILALKRLEPQQALISLLGPDEIKRRFLAEAETMGRLRHKHIATVWDLVDTPEQTFFLMEYFCQSLGDLIGETYDLEAPSRQLGVDKAVFYTRQTLIGLSRLHAAGIVHRDIKPFNLLLTEDDAIKITDFGLSRLRGETFPGPRRLRVGSPYYTAPEQERNPDLAEPRSDLYSAGVMLHRLVTGLLPLTQSPRPREVNPDLDDAWDVFFQKAMNKDPKARFDHAEAMLDALDDLYAGWRKTNDRLCRLHPPAGAQTKKTPHPPRKIGIKTTPKQAFNTFGLDNLWRPRVYTASRFRTNNEGLAVDPAAGLTWQTSGSEFPLTRAEALDYINGLNQRKWGGFKNWRLPTVEELITLLRPPHHAGDQCLEPIFDPEKNNLWTIDTRSALAAWYINTDLGFVAWQDFTCYFYVRAVRSFPVE